MKKTRREAIALGYEEEKHSAPNVMAKGEGYVADRIISKANDHNVPIQEDASLVELLSELNINEQIPEELYHVVAEVFAFIYRTDQDAHK
ncbi:EscU/YscU/HrcU family type III secretion system export apparatus switch protein [Thalassobacillus sp. CUG 92003]|uniref:EscU/YscU/HrcU family type III secretion system export apparatus switch protein n=1 Tax=Thalassobacillus sp. CUG 92003 TaxID=2736641 RepID=UPI0015E6C070|nr:EscU/YscU/HrcU family type III secretion system export apparatus switch protein [Thalassobacillus sp. CUG 92003]